MTMTLYVAKKMVREGKNFLGEVCSMSKTALQALRFCTVRMVPGCDMFCLCPHSNMHLSEAASSPLDKC